MPTWTFASSPMVRNRSAGLGESPLRFGVSRPHDWPARNSQLPRLRSSQYKRRRLVWLLEVTKTLAGSLPLKSPSRYPTTLLAPYLPETFRLKREYCPVDRNSVRCPWTVLLNGIWPKLVAATLVVLVERKMFSKSTKPPGVKSVPPMRNESGDSLGLSVSCTVLVAVVGGAVCNAASATRGVPEVLSSSRCSRVWMCSCCCAICFCCS